jgi:RNA polymerase sigma-70 factor (ECF subfamily)
VGDLRHDAHTTATANRAAEGALVDGTVTASVTLVAPMATEDDDADEAQVLAAAQRGDRGAQATLFHRYRDRVARQLLRMCGDRSAVEDLIQEVFISAFAALPRFRGDARLSTWLYTIANNRVRNYWESQRRRKHRELDAARTSAAAVVDTPEEDLVAQRQRQRLYAALATLPDKMREAFVARAIEGMSLLEASEALQTPISTVSFRTRRAEQLLCEALDIPWHDALPGAAVPRRTRA